MTATARTSLDRKHAKSLASAPSVGRIRSPIALVVPLFMLLLLWSSLVSVSHASSVAAPAVKAPPPLPVRSSSNPVVTEPMGKPSGGGGNPVFNLFGYIKNSVVKTVDSCGLLWSNYGKCKEIRKLQQDYRDRIANQWELQGLYSDESRSQIKKRLQSVQGGISYSDYVFLQKGKEDRGKVLNIVFLMWGAPRFLPYALMFNPDMLPSPFTADRNARRHAASLESTAHRQSRERSAAILQTLADLERSALAGATGGFLGNIFGSKKQTQRHERLVRIYNETKSMLSLSPAEQAVMSSNTPLSAPLSDADDASSPSTPSVLSQVLEKLAYRDNVDFSRAEQRLCDIPACLVKGMGRAISSTAGGGVLSQLQPHFLQRGKVVSHLRKVSEADDFLVQANVNLDTISPRLLQEACSDRMMGGPDWSLEDLKDGLQEWLRLAVREPAAVLEERSAAAASRSTTMAGRGGGTGRLARGSTTHQLYYNGNTMRFALMAFFACQGSQGVGRVEPTLPQLLLKPSAIPGVDKTSSADSLKTDGDGSPKKGFFRR